MEALLAVLIVCLAALALGIGLLTGRGAPRRGCDGLTCVGGTRCAGCPNTAREGEN